MSRCLYRIPNQALDIYIMRDFVTSAECDRLIELIDADSFKSSVMGYNGDNGFRTNESCYPDPDDPNVSAIESRLHELTGIDPMFGEEIQGQRYSAGQEFKPHHDYFCTDADYWPEESRNGGQRTWTALIFLNSVEDGGGTCFPRAGLRIRPRRGSLLLWNNLDSSGAPNPDSLHGGEPVGSGRKYILTKWYRERPWGAAAD
jgi:prolyl 4-hydroxylase